MRIPELVNSTLELACRMRWGRDPIIALTGTAKQLCVRSVVVVIAEQDGRLLPEHGRAVRLEIEWPVFGLKRKRQLICRGIVSRVCSEQFGGSELHCDLRSVRFGDLVVKAPAQTAAGWRM